MFVLTRRRQEKDEPARATPASAGPGLGTGQHFLAIPSITVIGQVPLLNSRLKADTGSGRYLLRGSGISQPVLELGKELFDRIEIRGVLGQEEELGACSAGWLAARLCLCGNRDCR